MADVRILLVPGGGGSGPDHWDRRWEAEDERVERVIQPDWTGGDRAQWLAALDRYVRFSETPVVLVAHSLGNIVVAHWAATHSGPIIGALMVAPADVDADWPPEGSVYRQFRPVPMNALGFPSILVASTNDQLLSPDRARTLATAWGSRLHIAGALGHIGSASQLGRWEEGRRLLDQLTGPSLAAY
jgi:hypothetical protein